MLILAEYLLAPVFQDFQVSLHKILSKDDLDLAFNFDCHLFTSIHYPLLCYSNFKDTPAIESSPLSELLYSNQPILSIISEMLANMPASIHKQVEEAAYIQIHRSRAGDVLYSLNCFTKHHF